MACYEYYNEVTTESSKGLNRPCLIAKAMDAENLLENCS